MAVDHRRAALLDARVRQLEDLAVVGDKAVAAGRRRVRQPQPRGDYVFAGGNSLRDYPLITRAFRTLGTPLRMATSYRELDLPANIQCRSLPHADYMEELRAARHVVVPLAQSTVYSHRRYASSSHGSFG